MAAQAPETIFRQIFDGLPDVVVAVDRRNKAILHINKPAALLFGRPPQSLVGQSADILFASSGKFSIDFVLEQLAMNDIWSGTQDIVRDDGAQCPVEVHASLVPWLNDQFLLLNLHDASSRLQTDRAKNEFVSTAAHELRTPLTIIREGISQVLEGICGEVNEDQREMLEMSLEGIDRLARIIADLLDISKIEAGKLVLKREMLDLTAVVQQVSNSFQSRSEERGLTFRTSLPHSPVHVYADQDKLIQVFTNLIGNALKFTEKGGITLEVKETEQGIRCGVIDTGKGIDKDDLPNVFGKFKQFGHKAVTGEKGTGLGLSISKGLIELHGGRIWVESELHEGTSMIFTLPQYSAEEVFRDRINQGINKARKDNGAMSIVLLQMQSFEELHTAFGRERSHDLIREIEQAIRSNLRQDMDLVVSQTETMLLLLPGTEGKDAESVIERVLTVCQNCIRKAGAPEAVQMRSFLAVYPDQGVTPDELYDQALRTNGHR